MFWIRFKTALNQIAVWLRTVWWRLLKQTWIIKVKISIGNKTVTRACILFYCHPIWLVIYFNNRMIDIHCNVWGSLHSSSVPVSELSLPDLGTNCSTSSVAVRRISATDLCSAVFFNTVGHPQGMVLRTVNFSLAFCFQLYWGYAVPCTARASCRWGVFIQAIV